MLGGVFLLVTTCGAKPTVLAPTPSIPAPTAQRDLPEIITLQLDQTEIARYESIELTVGLEANYSNPYDVSEVALDAVFMAPNGESMNVPGFWDGEASWKIRFTPWSEGTWTYRIVVTNSRGQSLPSEGEFTVRP